MNDDSVYRETQKYAFDYVANEDAPQDKIFEYCQDLFDSFMNGYNATIFAYGQTSSGKTYTMTGVTDAIGNTQQPGLIPRGLDYIFNRIAEKMLKSEVEYLLKCSFVEIYNEQVYDLLDKSQQRLNVRVNINNEVFIQPLTEVIVTSPKQAEEVLKSGLANRHVASTNMNRESSRSHAVFSLILESKEKNNGIDNIKRSCLYLVDLAGSERQAHTKSEGTRLKEAGMINQSLLTLGNVIRNLADVSKGKSRHVCYRQSKLTLILKDSIGGNSKAILIACVHPNAAFLRESISTLGFAGRAKMIKNKAKINLDIHGDLESLREEVNRLRYQLTIHCLLPPIKESEMETDSVWKVKFISAMILRACLIYDAKYHVEKIEYMANSLANMENSGAILEKQNQLLTKSLQKIREHNIDQEEGQIDELIQTIAEANIKMGLCKDKLRQEVSVDKLEAEIQHLKTELVKAKTINTISGDTLLSNVYLEYNELVVDKELKKKTDVFTSEKMNLVKMQELLNKYKLDSYHTKVNDTESINYYKEAYRRLEKEYDALKNRNKNNNEFVDKAQKKMTMLTNNFKCINSRPRKALVARNDFQNLLEFDPTFAQNMLMEKAENEKIFILERDVKDLRINNEDLKKQLLEFKGLEKNYKDLKQKNETKELKIKDYEQTIKSLSTEKNDMKNAYEKSINKLNKDIDELKLSLENIESEKYSYLEDNAVLKKQCDLLEQKQEVYFQSIENLQVELETKTKASDVNLVSSANDSNLAKELLSLQSQVRDLIIRLETTESEKITIQASLQHAIDQGIELEDVVKDLTEQQNNLENEMESVLEKYNSCEETNEKIIEDIYKKHDIELAKRDAAQAEEMEKLCNQMNNIQHTLNESLICSSVDSFTQTENDNQIEAEDLILEASSMYEATSDDFEENAVITGLQEKIDTLNSQLQTESDIVDECNDFIKTVLCEFKIQIEKSLLDNIKSIVGKLHSNNEDCKNLVGQKVNVDEQLRVKTEQIQKLSLELDAAFKQRERLNKTNEDLLSLLPNTIGHSYKKQKIQIMNRMKNEMRENSVKLDQLTREREKLKLWAIKKNLLSELKKLGIDLQ